MLCVSVSLWFKSLLLQFPLLIRQTLHRPPVRVRQFFWLMCQRFPEFRVRRDLLPIPK